MQLSAPLVDTLPLDVEVRLLRNDTDSSSTHRYVEYVLNDAYINRVVAVFQTITESGIQNTKTIPPHCSDMMLFSTWASMEPTPTSPMSTQDKQKTEVLRGTTNTATGKRFSLLSLLVIVLAKRAHIYVLQYPRIIDSVSEDEDPQEEDEMNITALSDDALEMLLMSTSVLLDEEVYIPMPKYRKF